MLFNSGALRLIKRTERICFSKFFDMLRLHNERCFSILNLLAELASLITYTWTLD